MPLHVQCQMIGSGEGSFTEVALKRPVSGMFPVVTRQLVGSDEFPATTFPVAVVWLFTCGYNEQKTFVMMCA